MRTRRMASTFVSSANASHQDRVFAGSGKISVQSSSGPVVAAGGGTRYGFIQNPILAPLGSTVTAASLVLTLRTAVTVATTLYVERIADRWAVDRTTWRSKPAVSEVSVVSVVVPAGTPKGAVVAVDITSIVAPCADGAPQWRGVRLRSSSLIQFESEDHPTYEMRPQYVVAWSDVPDAPSGMIPSDGRAVGEPTPTLSWDFIDYGGDTSISKVHVQIATTSSVTSPVYDSGEQPSSASALTPVPTASYPAGFVAAPGVTYYWRARHADGAGLWSGWSSPASFTFAALPSITVTSLTGGVFTDATPLLIADAPDMAQWRVRVALGGRVLWSSNRGYREDGSEIRVQVPAKVITEDDRDYTFIFQVWDSVDRVETAGRPTYRTLSVTARFDDDAVLAPVTSLSATDFSPAPGVEVAWQRTSPADGFIIYRDGDMIDRVDAEDVLGEPGWFSYVDLSAPGGEHVYKVRAVENGRSSGTGGGAPVVSDVSGRWVILDDGRMFPIFNREGAGEHGLALREKVEEVELADGRIAVQTTGMRGYDGTIDGIVMDVPHGYGLLTLEDCEALVKEVRLAGRARFAQDVLNLPVRVLQVNLTRSHPASLRSSDVSLRVIQDSEEERYGLIGGWQ